MRWGSWVLLVVALILLRQEDNELAQTVVVLGGAAAVLGWGIIPVVVSAADMTLDPARFTTFAVPMRQLLAGLALGGLIGIPGRGHRPGGAGHGGDLVAWASSGLAAWWGPSWVS